MWCFQFDFLLACLYDGFNEELNKRISYEIYSENLFGQKH